MAGKAQPMLPGFGQQPSRNRPPRRSVDHGRKNRREAHEASKPRHSGDRARIVELLQERGGATRYEISVALQLPYTTVSARVTDLKRLGYVEDSPEKRMTPTGTPACVVILRAA